MRPIQWLAVGFFLLLDFCTGQRMVSIQKGRLYRAKGYHVTIWCNVSGYQGQLQQDFQWSIYKPSAPLTEIQMISTQENFSPYAMYAQRVRSREIYIERLQGDSVLLYLTDLKDQDAGEYQCYTPNTDSKYFGTYSAKMNLSVIPDTLSATMKMQSLSRDQGDSLELICEVSTATTIHTHLSVAWYILKKGDGQAQKIISLSRDFVLLPGSSYQQRFSSGDVRLDKTGSKEYKLSIAKIQPSDQGEVYCEGVEWIQDPDETWKDIARKQTNRISLTVRSLDRPTYMPPLFTGSHMQLFLSTNHQQTVEGSTLVFHCNGTITEKSLSVTWWHIKKNGDPPLFIASMDQDGTLKIGHSYLERSVNGELRLEKLGPSTFTLTIYKSSAIQNSGLYRCEVAELSKGKSWSQEISTKVEPLELNLNAELRSRKPSVKLYEDVELFCIVSGNGITSQVPVSITWQFKDSSGMTGYQQVVKVTAGGNVEWGSSAPHLNLQKKAQIIKSSSVSQLLIHSATWHDTGMYRCEVEIWKNSGPARSSAMAQHVVKPSNPIEIKVTTPESKLITDISEKSLDVFSDEDITIDCKILSLTKNSTLEITWYFLPLFPKNAAPLMILRTNYDHVSEYGEAFNSPRQKSRFHNKKVSSHLFQLLILSANNDVHGKYYCEVNEWIWVIDDGWHSLGKMRSGQTTVYFKLSENKPHTERTNHSITTTGNEDGTLKCILQSPIQPTSRFFVSWFKMSEHFAAATQGEIKNNGSDRHGNLNMAKRSQPHSPSVGNFCLKLQDVEMANAGLFFCQVEEWQAPNSSTAPIQDESAPTNSFQICSPQPLYRFLLFYPPVLFLILVGVFLMLYFRRKRVSETLEQNMISGEELTFLAPSHFEPSGKNCDNNITENESSQLKKNEID